MRIIGVWILNRNSVLCTSSSYTGNFKKYATGSCYVKFSCALVPANISQHIAQSYIHTPATAIRRPVTDIRNHHYNDVIMSAMASQITSLTIVYSTVYSGAEQRKHQSSTSLDFVRGFHRWPVNSPHKGPLTRKIWWRHHGYSIEANDICPYMIVNQQLLNWYVYTTKLLTNQIYGALSTVVNMVISLWKFGLTNVAMNTWGHWSI